MSQESASADVMELGTELGEALAGLPEYEAFEAAKETVDSHPDVQKKMQEFEQMQKEFMVARQQGEATEEDLDELRAVREELEAMEAMQELREAQDDLVEVLEAVNESISAELELDFGDSVGSCGCE